MVEIVEFEKSKQVVFFSHETGEGTVVAVVNNGEEFAELFSKLLAKREQFKLPQSLPLGIPRVNIFQSLTAGQLKAGFVLVHAFYLDDKILLVEDTWLRPPVHPFAAAPQKPVSDPKWFDNYVRYASA